MKTKEKLTLHEAMKTTISKLGSMKAKQLAWIINNSNLYQKKDLSELKTSQIYARINKYPDMFYVNEEKCICLR